LCKSSKKGQSLISALKNLLSLKFHHRHSQWHRPQGARLKATSRITNSIAVGREKKHQVAIVKQFEKA